MALRSVFLGLLFAGLALMAGHRPAQAADPVGLQNARNFMDRMVRVVGRQGPGKAGETGYGFIVGQAPTANGLPGVLMVVPDHIVRDPAHPEARFNPPLITFYADLSRTVPAELLEQHLPPAQGDLALIVLGVGMSGAFKPVPVADTENLRPAASAWQDGRRGEWQASATPGRFGLRDPAGWLDFEGLDVTDGAHGAAVLGEPGLLGMLVGPDPLGNGSSRVLSIGRIYAKVREWGFQWQMPAPGVAPVEAQAPAPPPRPPALELEPVRMVSLLPDELKARSAWIPPNARLSPWPNTTAALRASPRKDAQRIGSMPAGTQLPYKVWSTGAYEIDRKLDGGAWFIAASGGQPIGYVAGGDIIEMWPIPTTPPPATAKVVRDWIPGGGKPEDPHAVLRDAGTYYDLTIPVTCQQDFCDTISVFTPRPPIEGGMVPTYQAPPITGSWKQDDRILLHLQLPRALIDSKTTQLIACPGSVAGCDVQKLWPAS